MLAQPAPPAALHALPSPTSQRRAHTHRVCAGAGEAGRCRLCAVRRRRQRDTTKHLQGGQGGPLHEAVQSPCSSSLLACLPCALRRDRLAQCRAND